MPVLKIFPSLLSADFGKLQSEIERLEPLADGFHFDVMDGHFVPNLSMGAPILSKIRTGKLFDVHLMVTNPEERLEEFAKAGATMISFHVEAAGENSGKILKTIRSLGMKGGIALKPKTPLSVIEPFLSEVDYVVIMSVEPGFGGQEFMPEVLEKARTLRRNFPELDIEIDGGIKDSVAEEVRNAGANILVTGAYLFGAADPKLATQKLRESIS